MEKKVLLIIIFQSYQRIMHLKLKCKEINLIKQSYKQEASKHNLNQVA